LGALLCLILWSAPALAQSDSWVIRIWKGEAAYRQGNYPEAEKDFVAAVGIAEQFGADDPRLLRSLNDLGQLYGARGGYAQAAPLFKRALAIAEKALGPEHPDVAVILNNLAELYRAQGKYAEAEPLYKRALATLEKALGPEHPDVATNLNNLALLY